MTAMDDIWFSPNEYCETRTVDETMAVPGKVLLRKSAWWVPEDDCRSMPVPEMIRHIYSRRKSSAVAPNGHTCPFLTLEEWSRINDWVSDMARIWSSVSPIPSS